MTQENLISVLSQRLGWEEQDTTNALEAIIETLIEELSEGNKVDIDDVGLFETRKHSEYILVDQESNERYLMPPSLEVVFSSTSQTNDHPMHFIPDESMEKEVSGSLALFEPTLLNEGVQFPEVEVVKVGESIHGETRADAQIPNVDEASVGVANLGETPTNAQLPEVDEAATDISNINDSPINPQLFEVKDETAHEPGEKKKLENTPPAHGQRRATRTRRKRRPSVWIPVLGGVAIAVAILFFFKPTRDGKTTAGNKSKLNAAKDTIAPVPVYAPPKKVVLEEGKTLRLLAEEVYGNREFWIYIFLDNQHQIANPNVVPHGLELLIPDASKYDINPSDSLSVAKAMERSDEVLESL